MVALGLTRWQARADRNESEPGMPRSVATNVGLGAAGIVLACVTHIPFDRHQRLPVLTWTSDSLRPIIAVISALAGIFLAVRAMLPALRGNWKAVGVVKLVLLSAYSGLLMMCGVLAFLQLTTVQALRTIAMLVLAGGGLLLMLAARGQAAKTSRRAQLLIGTLASVSIVVLAIVVRADSAAPRFRTGMFSAMILAAVIIMANTLLEY
jgi:hypothetical protein